MKLPAVILLAAAALPIIAQAPATTAPAPPGASAPAAPIATAPSTTAAATAPAAVNDTVIGFSYALPGDWQMLASTQATPDVPYPTVQGPKKGNACTQVELTARRGTPASVVVVVALPFGCYGQTLTSKNLADFATGASEGLKETFDVSSPVISNYTLGSHNMWIERASGVVKGQPNAKYMLEIACTVMAKGAACWMTMAADAASLQAFEQEAVTLEGDAFDAIVPATAIQAAPPAPAASKPS